MKKNVQNYLQATPEDEKERFLLDYIKNMRWKGDGDDFGFVFVTVSDNPHYLYNVMVRRHNRRNNNLHADGHVTPIDMWRLSNNELLLNYSYHDNYPNCVW